MTTNESIERTTTCPLCENNVSVNKLAILSLSHEHLLLIAQHAKEGTLGYILNIAEITLNRLDPEKTNAELQIKEALSTLTTTACEILEKQKNEQRQFLERFAESKEGDKTELIKKYQEERIQLTQNSQNELYNGIKNVERIQKDWLERCSEINHNVQDIRCKIFGNSIGNITEKIVIKDLSAAIKTDQFSDELALKHGTDIVGTIIENGLECGRISVSVKSTQRWDNEFIIQLENNMRNDGTKVGILATKSFPSDALNDTMYVPQLKEGRTIMIVKPEYVSIAYCAMREVAINLFKTKRMLERKDQETDEEIEIFKILMIYINGDEFREGINYIEQANKESQKTIDKLSNMRCRLNTDIDNAIKSQTSIKEHLGHAKELIGKLRELLNNSS